MTVMALSSIVIFCLYGRGGYTVNQDVIDNRPWRIVIPALVLFAIFSISEIVYSVLLQVLMKSLCDELIDPSIDYRYCGNYGTMLTPICWLIALTIMVARVIRAPDFELVVHKQSSKAEEFMPIGHSGDNSKENFIFINPDDARQESKRF